VTRASVVFGRLSTDPRPRIGAGFEPVNSQFESPRSSRMLWGSVSGAVVTTISALPRESQVAMLSQSTGSRSSLVGDHEPLPIVKTQLPDVFSS
jgi:hypothetical protein